MIHGVTTYARRHARAGVLAAMALVGALLAGSCGEDTPIDPGALRFGQIGKIVVDLDTPLQFGAGRMRQILSWGSGGLWSLQESVSYRDLIGEEYFERHTTEVAQSAGAYAEVITQLNDTRGIELDIPELFPDSVPVESCGAVSTKVTFTIVDEAKEEVRSWIRCVSGSLGTVRTEDAGPDPAASRIAQAVRMVRTGTLGDGWTSPYSGSVAFGTLDRGDDSKSSLVEPTTISDAATWGSFWILHGGVPPAPAVDFDEDMVVVAIMGERQEAGDSLEVRRILQIGNGTRIEVVELVPGDFCSPAARTHVPYHIVVAPRTPRPHAFNAIRREEVSCGG
jgi:hypothetical protein